MNEYETIDGKWWLFEDGKPKRPLTDEEAVDVIWGKDDKLESISCPNCGYGFTVADILKHYPQLRRGIAQEIKDGLEKISEYVECPDVKMREFEEPWWQEFWRKVKEE